MQIRNWRNDLWPHNKVIQFLYKKSYQGQQMIQEIKDTYLKMSKYIEKVMCTYTSRYNLGYNKWIGFITFQNMHTI